MRSIAVATWASIFLGSVSASQYKPGAGIYARKAIPDSHHGTVWSNSSVSFVDLKCDSSHDKADVSCDVFQAFSDRSKET